MKALQVAVHGGGDALPPSVVIVMDDGSLWRFNIERGQWREIALPNVPPPQPPRELEDTPVAQEPGTTDYSLVLHAFIDWLTRVHPELQWPTIRTLIERELEAEQQLHHTGSRPVSMREARAYARGNAEGLREGARAIEAAADQASKLPDAHPFRGALKELAGALRTMAKDGDR